MLVATFKLYVQYQFLLNTPNHFRLRHYLFQTLSIQKSAVKTTAFSSMSQTQIFLINFSCFSVILSDHFFNLVYYFLSSSQQPLCFKMYLHFNLDFIFNEMRLKILIIPAVNKQKYLVIVIPWIKAITSNSNIDNCRAAYI